MSKRSDMLDNIKTTLIGMSEFTASTVFVGQVRVPDLDEMTLPTAFILPQNENKPMQAMGFETWELDVNIEVLCKDSDVETLYHAIHEALMTDIYRGGYAMNFYRTGGDTMIVDAGRSLAAFQHTYHIEYRHPFGSP